MLRRLQRHDNDDYEREHLRPNEDKAGWDIFEDPIKVEEEGSMEDRKVFDYMERGSKLLAYIVVFILVLGCAIISKATLLFMTSQLSVADTKSYCNQDLALDKHFIVTLPAVERVLWVWVLMFAYFIPQLGTFVRSVRILCFKSWDMPGMRDAISITFSESCSTIGFALLVFGVLPELDVVKGAMLTNAICFVPAVLGLLSRNVGCNINTLRGAMDIVCIAAQATAFITWPLLPESPPILWLIPVSLFLISVGWWENFTPKSYSISFIDTAMKWLCRPNKAFVNDRYFIYMIVSLWKCILFFISVLIIFWAREDNVEFLFTNFELAFSEHYVNVTEILPLIGGMEGPNFEEAIQSGPGTQILTSSMTPLYLLLINALSTYVCFAVGKFACKIQIQGFSYALPVNLAVPVTISGLIAMCGEYNKDVCAFYDTIPTYLFFDSPPVYLLSDFISQQQSYIWLLWLLSQTWITIDLWTPICEKLARTEKLFVRPMFEPFCLDQDMGLNRRRDNDNEPAPERKVENDMDFIGEIDDDQKIEDKDNITMLYACGTMWHENKSEMMAFMKSILRLDEDQLVRMKAKKTFKVKIPNLFNLETHIFFDDAFIRRFTDDQYPQLNKYVLDLIDVVNEAVLQVHNNVRIRPPEVFETPYGGRLEWRLPGGNKMYAHLKDKAFIRVKKRWSQVMYMYYLLGYRLMDNTSLSAISKLKRGANTYILALDGDIDFQPKAVHLLADLMKKNRDLGAACGRIHPMGSGAMVWYQKFEYAIGHWLQKATEHMIGCVLCSPGCFSLFRGSALMDDSVMNKYTTTSEEALHFVQYDQGEDRWLCTLLLQRGHKVEYSAASDSFTHCPERFNEFYNQRRRWMPSTTANIIDLLKNYKQTVNNNDNISTMYILYQLILLVGTVLGPGTIFLMLVGAFVAAFQVEQWTSFLMNAIPIVFFMCICALCKEKVQLAIAGFLSTIYGLIMMAVLVGIMLQIQNDGVLAPSSLFFFCVAGEMIITALFHPKEIGCLPYGIVYYVTVPSMYMLLVIYSVFNMHVISWGTRDVSVALTEQKEKDADGTPAADAPPEKKGFRHKMYSFFSNQEENTGSFELSFAGLFKVMLCTSNVTTREEEQIKLLSESLRELHTKLDGLHNQMNGGAVTAPPTRKETKFDLMKRPSAATRLTGAEAVPKKPQPSFLDQQSDDDDFDELSYRSSESSYESSSAQERWIHCNKLRASTTRHLDDREENFWNACIKKYLEPIDEANKEKAQGLKDLRDKSVFAFFMLNAVFVLVVFLLTLKKDDIHIKWPLGIKANFTYQEDTGDIEIIREYLQLEPIGFVFLIFFAILLIVQFVAMFFHRFGTFSQILASTKINFTSFKAKNRDNKEETGVEAVLATRRMTRFVPATRGAIGITLPPRHRATLRNLTASQQPEATTYDLAKRFDETCDRYQSGSFDDAPVPRRTITRLMRASSMATFRDRDSRIDIRPGRGETRDSRHNITSV